jgi:uncharacterized protein (TIGR03118 family)
MEPHRLPLGIFFNRSAKASRGRRHEQSRRFRPRLEPLESRQLFSVSTITVHSVNVQATEGQFFAAEVATFTDSNGDLSPGHFHAQINWGDGTSSSGIVSSDFAHHQLKVSGTHLYKEAGSDAIAVTVTDQSGNSGVNAFYVQSNLVSDVPGAAAHRDPNLVNAWGIVPNPTGFWWVNDNHTGLSTLYDGSGNPQSLVVRIPPPMGSPQGTLGSPTGIVFNFTNDFQVTGGKSFFIFATEEGTISAWNPAILNDAQLKADNSPSGAVYKGLAAGSVGGNNFLYATDFHNGKIDVFDKQFAPTAVTGTFSDPAIPTGFAPFGIANIGGKLFVSYAQQDADAHDDAGGAGHGFIDVFSTDGVLLNHFAAHGNLNSPWGMVLAPANFGRFSGDLLVGNFGDGRINAFDPGTGKLLGQLQDSQGKPISVAGLWGLAYGNGAQAGPLNELFFSAGPDGEMHGLFGGFTTGGSASIATVADAKLIGLPSFITVARNEPFAGSIGAFSDRNPFAKSGDFKITIDWGDGSEPTTGTVVARGFGLFQVNGSHTYASKGKHEITISVVDEDGSTTTIESTALVFQLGRR